MNRLIKLIIPFLFIQLFSSCQKDEFYASTDAMLIFSRDTVLFDTIFTTIGSTTQRFTVKNPYNKNLNISSIYLAGGENSPFRINIDGFSGNRLENIDLRENDSLYIFVEITVDPNNSDLPIAIQDSIIFFFNNKQQDVDLLAWGQDVHLINGEIIETQNWVKDKPYLIYNFMLIDSNHILTIDPGVILHFHKGSRLYVKGTMIANGTFESPIIFQGDRLESSYKNNPGQWDGIWLMPGSKENIFNFTEIKNAVIGIQVDTLANISKPTLSLSNSKIQNMSSTGIYAKGSTILAYNNLITNCGQFAVALTIGGSYEFYHCTIANYWDFSTRNSPSVLLTNYYIDINNNIQVRSLNKALFGNCIIYGNKESEILLNQDDQGGIFNYKFDHSLIKVDKDFSTTDPTRFDGVIVNKDPNFNMPYEGNYELDTLSIAKDKGKKEFSLIYPLDINQNNRNSDLAPDPGAFERIENK